MLFPTKRKQGSLEKHLSSSDASNTQDELPCCTRKQGHCGKSPRLCQNTWETILKDSHWDGNYDLITEH